MDIHAQILDQRLSRLLGEHAEELPGRDPHAQRSAAFAVLCLQTVLGIDRETALSCLTEGAQDRGVDALHIGDPHDGEFVVTLVQAKYAKSLEGNKAFPANAIRQLVTVVGQLFAPGLELDGNDALVHRVAEVRGLLLDGFLPVLVYRFVESERKRPWHPQLVGRFTPYASHFLAMVVGGLLWNNAEREHRLEQMGLKDAPLPRLAATFRRGDLLARLWAAIRSEGGAA